MGNQYYYSPIFLLLGFLFVSPLHAAYYNNQDKGASKKEKRQNASSKRLYKHGDLTFIDREKDKVNGKELQQGLISLFQRIKAKEGRKVYFFVGDRGAGKSLSILALQGNKIKKVAKQTTDTLENELFINHTSPKKTLPKERFDVTYVLPKNQVPVLGMGYKGATKSTYIYYPNPKKPQYKGIAFGDTEGFFSERKATSAEKCLAATSFYYTAKINKVGGLVFVLSALELDSMCKKGSKGMAYMLQQYFAEAVETQSMRESLLVMITKVAPQIDSIKALENLKRLIQLSYSAYYFDLQSKERAEEPHRYVKRFFEMLLVQDVPKDKINNINNFTLDQQRVCCIFPWEEQCVQNILDRRLKRLKPIAGKDLCTFDNPLSRYMEICFRGFGLELNKGILPLLKLKRKTDEKEIQLAQIAAKKIIDTAIREIAKDIGDWRGRKSEMEKDKTLEAVFVEWHNEELPLGWRKKFSQIADKCTGYKLCKAFIYRERDPIYKIVATYGLEAELSEYHPSKYYRLPKFFGGAAHKLPFIEKHFKITITKHNNSTFTWKAVTKTKRGVKKDTWMLYHFTKGPYRARCSIKFYALTRERIATRKWIKDVEEKIESLDRYMTFWKERSEKYNLLACGYTAMVQKWQTQRLIQLARWDKTADMLQCYMHEILEDNVQKSLFKQYIAYFKEATRMKFFRFIPDMQDNNSEDDTALLEDEKANFLDQPSNEPELNDHQSADTKVFDID